MGGSLRGVVRNRLRYLAADYLGLAMTRRHGAARMIDVLLIGVGIATLVLSAIGVQGMTSLGGSTPMSVLTAAMFIVVGVRNVIMEADRGGS